MFRVLLLCVAVCWAGAACATDQLAYGPAPAWVRPLPIPTNAPVSNVAAQQLLLQDSQINFGPDGDEFYFESAVKILSPQGMASTGNIVLSWKPDTETLAIHKLRIIRGDQVIDVLATGKKFTVLRRESNLELAMLDGTLTATIQPEDLRVGDIVDMAFTQTRRDPVMRGRSEGFAAMARPGVIGRIRLRQLWPNSKSIRWRATDGLGAPTVMRTAGQTELTFDLSNVEAPKPPRSAPFRFNDMAELELSEFADWSEVSALMAPIYAKAARLSAASPLKTEIARIRAASSDRKVRAAAALHLVQEQTRYVFLGMNLGGYVPADADTTWSRRFGDCKGKTVLLLAILHELGIDAEPALVNTTAGDGMDERLPVLGVFDHVIVRTRIGGKTYWLDGTRLGDRGLDDLTTPNFKWALPLRDGGTGLERLEPGPLAEPGYEMAMRIDASAGLDAPAPTHLEYLYRGDEAIEEHLAYGAMGRSDAERSLREFVTKSYPWIKPSRVDYAYDDREGLMRLTIDGSATLDWSKQGEFKDFDIAESSLGWDASFKREPGPHQDAPYVVNFPDYQKWTVSISLLRKGEGFTLLNAQDVDKTIAGVAYQRSSSIENGVVTMVASQRSLEPEFPAAEADGAATALREMYKTDVVVRSPSAINGGGTDDLDTASMPDPVDAGSYNRRGTVFLLKGDNVHAVADFTKAAQLDPKNPKTWYNLGVANYDLGHAEQAVSDFSRALELNPIDVLARMARAELYLSRGDEKRATQDFDYAVGISPGNLGVQLRRARAYERAGRFPQAVQSYEQLISRVPAGRGTANYLNERCWAIAEWGQQLDRGLADCDASLKLSPGNAAALDSRGLIRLRMGQYDKAIADYDAALRLRPNQSASLYGRGIAKRRSGTKAAGEADIAAATKIDPSIAKTFAGFGVRP